MTTFTCPCGEIVKMDWESPRYGLCERCEQVWRENYDARRQGQGTDKGDPKEVQHP